MYGPVRSSCFQIGSGGSVWCHRILQTVGVLDERDLEFSGAVVASQTRPLLVHDTGERVQVHQ